MLLDYVPLLQVQRDLYALPRNMARFRQYLRTMIDREKQDLKLPLVAMNPMGKEHLPVFLDRLIEFDADGVAGEAASSAAGSLRDEPGIYKVCLVVSDDLLGGWTNRYTSEFVHRFHEIALNQRGWITGILWTSETYDADSVRLETAVSVFRAAYIRRNGVAGSLGEMMAQEVHTMRKSKCPPPTLDIDDLRYTREVLAPLLGSSDRPTVIAALFGDAAARELGYPPLGLSPRAGLELAQAMAYGCVPDFAIEPVSLATE
jgi:hypothetical protein